MAMTRMALTSQATAAMGNMMESLTTMRLDLMQKDITGVVCFVDIGIS